MAGSLFYGGGGGSLFYGAGGGSSDPGASGGGVNLEAVERTGRRTSLLSSYAQDLVLTAPDAALALAESSIDDDEMLRSAVESTNFASIQRISEGLAAESPEVQDAMFKGLPKPIADALQAQGYRPPDIAKDKGGSRWGINLPDFLPVDELTISRDIPVLGDLGVLQAGAGEVLEGARDVTTKALTPFAWLGEQPAHLYRAMKYTEEEEGLSFAESFNPFNYFSPSQLAESWSATDPDAGYVKPGARERARDILGGDKLLYDIAHGRATGKTDDEIIRAAGYELDSPEALEMSLAMLEASGLPQLQDAIHELSVGQVSFGRTIAQDSFGLDDTNSGFGRILSGTIDAGFAITSDPTLGLGRATKANRFGRWAFMLETQGDFKAMSRVAEIAANLERSRAGAAAVHAVGNIRPSEMRRAQSVLRWADTVATGFQTGKLAELGRSLPNSMTALSQMADANTRRLVTGGKALTSTEGVLEWLLERDGFLAMAGTRLGGKSPMVQGLRMPSLTRAQQVAMKGKQAWTDVIDWSRMQYTFSPDATTWADKMSEFTSVLGSPTALTRQVGQFMLAQTAGNTGRLISSLTAHAPYRAALPLFGEESVAEFSRLVNMGLFGRMDRSTMDSFIDDFIQGDLVARANIQERFLEQLFRQSGIADTDFARRFVGRHRQAYSIDGTDLVDIGDVQSHAARLVDVHHADALAIPSFREFFRETARVNTARFLFNNHPSSWIDAQLGRWWKPAVLMRLGFIPRAAGEELLHYMLKMGPRRYMGAKGAQWFASDELSNDLEARLLSAQEMGQVDEVNRLTQQLAQTKGSLTAPLRSLAGATDRLMTRILESDAVVQSGWRRKATDKAEALDERGVVSGLEWFATEKSLWASGVIERLAALTHMPSKAEVGRIMAERWNPNAIRAARLMLSDPRVQRAYVEQVAGSTFTPWEFIGTTDVNGAPIPKVEWSDRSGAMPVMRQIPMKPDGTYRTQSLVDTGGDVTSFFHSIFSRQQRLRKDRVGSAVLNDVLPRWVGTFAEDLGIYMGYDDMGTLRDELNMLWSWAGDGEVDGPSLLGAARKLMDEPDEEMEGLRVWLGQNIDAAAADLGLGLNGRTLSGAFLDTDVSNPVKHWLAYENVDPTRLIDDWGVLERQVQHRARGRLSRPDMQRKLQEMRLYADDGLAVPVKHGIRKVYVPMVPELPDILSPAFVEAAARNIRYIGGYSEARARAIAQNVADSLHTAREAAAAMPTGGMLPLSGWGASDPRVADAVMAAADEVMHTRSTHGILEVPEDVVQRAAGDRAEGLRTRHRNWQTADDYFVDAFRLVHTRNVGEHRRLVNLEVGDDWWDDVDLNDATAAYNMAPLPGKTRLYRSETTWSPDPPDGPFDFVDVDDAVAARYGDSLPEDLVVESGVRRLPAVPPEDGNWLVTGRDMAPGLGEIEALERVADASMGEVLDVLSTLRRQDLDNDVLHEVIEPMLRPSKAWVDDAGNKQIETGYGFDHLVMGVDWERLPQETYGPVLAASPDFRWNKMVQTWFEGPVDQAISALIRSPMFLDNYGQQLQAQQALVDLFVDDDIAELVRMSGLDDDQLDSLALAVGEDGTDEVIAEAMETLAPGVPVGEGEMRVIRRFVQQRAHGLNTINQNALNRAIQLTTPYIDDHRVRSAFQNYVGNFIPFHFAEEQFLKRWTRTIKDSPEIIARAQLGMNGMRSMGVIRKDDQGNEIFVYPLAGEAVSAISGGVASMFGENLRVPWVGAMTGEVGYTLPGLGDRFGVPSVGPLVAMPLELLSRHFPELADIERQISGPGADRPVWSYFVPSWAGNAWTGVFGSIDKAQMASATNQAIQMLAVNGDMPPENATPREQQEFIERAQGIARTIIFARGIFGMAAPAAPRYVTKADELNSEYVELLRNSPSPDEATAAFVKLHPDAEPADLLAATVFTTESTYPGLGTPTEETFSWVRDNEELVGSFPAAAPWLLPRAGADDEFSYRAWAQQVAKGLRVRKSPDQLVDDIRFAGAARDYFNAKTLHDADMLVSQGDERSQYAAEWNSWKAAYFRQHPVFARMLEDPTRQQNRAQAMDQLEVLANDPEGPVPAELREFVGEYRRYQWSLSGLRGARTQAAAAARSNLTGEFVSWAEWQVQRYPWLAGFYLRVIRPDLQVQDEDGTMTRAA